MAERLAVRGHKCRIPFTHDRLNEAHHWWHEMARNYHEPDRFRYALGAFIQAARNVTWMLQKEQAAFEDFGWYLKDWRAWSKEQPVLLWLDETRTEFVKRQALGPSSTLEVRCIGNPQSHADDYDDEDEDGNGPLIGDVSPFECTHYYMARLPRTNHGHEFVRHWELDSLPGRELLDACREIFGHLHTLVEDAHQRAGAGMEGLWDQSSGGGAPPCMTDIMRHRRVITVVRDGREVWQDEPPGLHEGSS